MKLRTPECQWGLATLRERKLKTSTMSGKGERAEAFGKRFVSEGKGREGKYEKTKAFFKKTTFG